MLSPIRRQALRERERLDWKDERAAAAEESPEDRVQLALELAEVARTIAEAAGAAWAVAPPDDLLDKAHRYSRALRALARS